MRRRPVVCAHQLIVLASWFVVLFKILSNAPCRKDGRRQPTRLLTPRMALWYEDLIFDTSQG